MNKGKLKYSHYSIVFQEVPDEVTLVFNITGCPHKCEGCHSQYLANDFGYYVENDIMQILQGYKNLITCVCFMGGDQNISNLICLLNIVKENNLKTCVYSGLNTDYVFEEAYRKNLIDYIKIGSYEQKLGGLDSKTTNQKFYHIDTDCNALQKNKTDITYMFQKEII